jgi:hypothetical protein
MPSRTHTRAAFAGVAATGSLVAAVVAGALVVGGLLGFGAFPGTAEERAAAPLHVAPAQAGGHGTAPRRTRAPRRHAAIPGAPALAPPAAARPTPSTASTPAQHPPVQSATPPPAPADSEGPLAPAAQAARDTSATAAGSVAPVAPQAAGPVHAAGAVASDAVEQPDHAVAATLNGLGR